MNRVVWLGLFLCWAGGVAADSLSVEFSFSEADLTLQAVENFTLVGLRDGTRPMDEAGAPAIPAQYVNLLLPAGARNISISAVGEPTLVAKPLVPYPAQPRRPKSKPRAAFVPPNARYASPDPWPAEVATGQGDHAMQGYRFVSVRVNPLVYIGAEQALYLRRSITVTATYDLGPEPRAISTKQKSVFEPLVMSLVANPSVSAAFAPQTRTAEPRAALDYLIITSAGLSNAFQRIADYRATPAGGGYTTRVMTTNEIWAAYPGTDMPARIRACISNSVATMGTTMVLLGGDDTIVPVRKCWVSAAGDTETEMPTDLYYSSLTGSWNADGDSRYGETSDGVNLAWDVVVGRLPARTAANVTNYLNRVMAYESGSPVTDKIILGGPEAWDTYSGNGRPSDNVTIDGHPGFRSSSPPHTYVSDSEAWLRRLYRDGIYSNWPATVGIMCDTLTSWDASSCGDHLQSAANTLAAFNRNWTHLMFSGHGAPQEWGLESGNFTQSSAAGMTGLTAFVYTDACLTGHFDKNSNSIDGYTYTTEPCLAEGFLRNARTLGGALAYMGCARYGWGEPDPSPASNTANGGPSTVYAYKFYKRMYETPGRTLGVAFAMHKADMISLSGTDDCERWIQFGMNLLGDPALKMPVPRDAPPAISLQPSGTNKSVAVGSTLSFTVTATDPDGLAVSIAASGLPAGATAPAGSGTGSASTTFTWTPGEAQAGAHTVTFSATDKDGTATLGIRIAVTAGGTAADLFISEYVEGSGSEKYVEIFNGTGADVDLSGYALILYANGASSPTASNLLAGTLASGAVKVYRNSAATLYAGDTLTAVNFNGDDALALWKRSSSSFVDIFGRIGEDPGVAWTSGAVSTLDKTLVRKPAVTGGVTVNPANGFPTLGTEWDVHAQDTVLYLGSHDFGGGGGAVAPVFQASGAQSATVGVARVFTVAATGSPEPVLALSGTTASSGYGFQAETGELTYTPPPADGGTTRTFTFTASNSAGVATQTVSVTVSPAPLAAPVFHSVGMQHATVGVEKAVEVSASGNPDPVLALRSATASGGSYAFTAGTGVLTYTPPPADLGAQTFTFTASNSQGVATQTMAVTVVEAGAGGGMETFDGFPNSSGNYLSGTLVGQDGSTWSYAKARGDISINGLTPTIRNEAGAFIESGVISGGVGDLAFQYRRPYSGAAMGTLVYVIGQDSVYTGVVTELPVTTNEVLTFTAADVNISGDFVLLITNKSTTARIAIDDITWTGYSSGTPAGAPPTVDSIAAKTVMLGRMLTHTVTATEPDGDAVLLACSSAVNTARWTFNTQSGAFAFAPTSNELGMVQFSFTAADKDGMSAPAVMDVAVLPPPPVLGFDPPINGTHASLAIESQPGVPYVLEYVTDLLASPQMWNLADEETGTGEALVLEDEDPSDPQRFYRVIIP